MNSPDHQPSLTEQIDAYFASVTDAELEADLKASDYSTYSKIGQLIDTSESTSTEVFSDSAQWHSSELVATRVVTPLRPAAKVYAFTLLFEASVLTCDPVEEMPLAG